MIRQKILISIHTPTKGATAVIQSCIAFVSCISIHTPTKGATRRYFRRNDIIYQFQSTLPRRERHSFWFVLLTFDDFNPHSHEGSDSNAEESAQSLLHDFNPHSHEGSDVIDWEAGKLGEISIHTPTKGATQYQNFYNFC